MNIFRFLSEFSEIANLNLVEYLRLHTDKRFSRYIYPKLDEKYEEAKLINNSLSQLHDFHNNAYTTLQTDIKTHKNTVEQAYKIKTVTISCNESLISKSSISKNKNTRTSSSLLRE